MARWAEFVAAAPELAASAQRFFDAHRHKTIATLRRDGRPRISGTEVVFWDGDVWLGSMSGSLKAQDLRRDGRCALHSGSDDPDAGWEGDAKLSGTAIEVVDPAEVERWRTGNDAPPEDFHLFRIDMEEAVVTTLADSRDQLVIEWWTPAGGRRRAERA